MDDTVATQYLTDAITATEEFQTEFGDILICLGRALVIQGGYVSVEFLSNILGS